MKITTIALMIFLPFICAAQLAAGKYRLCFERYWKCHTQIALDLKGDNSYHFLIIDDTGYEESSGNWYIQADKLYLVPFIIPDSINITLDLRKIKGYPPEDLWNLSPKTHKRKKDNVIVINHYYEPYIHKELRFYQGKKERIAFTDSFGCIFYKGKEMDSLAIMINEREFTFDLDEHPKQSLIFMEVDDKYKDLVYRILGSNYIEIEKGKMCLEEKNKDKPNKRLYFEKIE